MTESIFTVQTPTSGDLSDAAPGLTLCTLWTPAVNGTVTGIRWFFPVTAPASNPIGVLYERTDDTTGTLLAQKTFTSVPSATWGTVMLDTPVSVTAGQYYYVGVWTPDRYVASADFFEGSSTVNGNLTAPADDPGIPRRNGRFNMSATPAYPNGQFNETSYFADILFEAGAQVTGFGVSNLGPLTGTAEGLVTVPGTLVTDLGALSAGAQGTVTGHGLAVSDLGLLTATAIGTVPDRPSPIQHLEDMMATMLACLCEATAARPSPPQHCCYRIGPEVAYDADIYTDLCCEGLAYVSLGDVYPVVDSFPEQSIVTQANQVCSFPSWAVNIKAGIIRCVPVGTDTEMPSCTDWNAAMVQHIFDTQSLASAACCFKQAWVFDVEPGMSVVIGPNSTTTPQGGCVERFITLQVQTSVCPAC